MKRDPRDFVPYSGCFGPVLRGGRVTYGTAGRRDTSYSDRFYGLDDFLGGLQRSDLVVLAARPSLGKTSLALNIARSAAVVQKACVALCSLEMSREAVVQRLLASESGVDSRKGPSRALQ
jgi:replicative DNA helicase